jgi:very-short-patch-repair endonuclease
MEKQRDYGEDPHPQPLSLLGRGELEREIDRITYWEIPIGLKQKMTEVARHFRKEPTDSEDVLWQAIRGRKLNGRKFRRQQPIGVFVVDFFCASEKLIVEVDGKIHESQQEHDQQRQELQELLESLGLKVVRITNNQVETDLNSVLLLINQQFSSTSQPKK